MISKHVPARWVVWACAAASVAGLAADAPIQWASVEGARLPLPPAEHPRLYLRAEHVAELPLRLEHPALKPAVDRLEAMARRSPPMRIEWDALKFLVSGDVQQGRAVIETALPLLRKCELADRQDACRETGRMMVTGAIAYDWCYRLLTGEEKQAFIRELVRLAKTQECGYPPIGQGSVTGHASEAMIMRDMLSAGIAIYDEFPEMYRLAAGRFFREHLPARQWFYGGHAYHQGDSYGAHRFSWDTYPLWIFDRLGAGNVYGPEQRWIPYLWVYTTRPDGQRLRAGDTFAHSAPWGRPWSEYMGTLLVMQRCRSRTLCWKLERSLGLAAGTLPENCLRRRPVPGGDADDRPHCSRALAGSAGGVRRACRMRDHGAGCGLDGPVQPGRRTVG